MRALADERAAQARQQQVDRHNAWTEHFSALGLLQAPAQDETVYLWPENVLAWECWADVQSQWRHGVGGPTGLDYAGVRAHLDELGLAGAQRRDVWDGIRACERETLAVFDEQQQYQQQQQQRG